MAAKDSGSDDEVGKLPPVSFLEPKEIKRLIGILSAAGGLELELENQGARLRIRMPDTQSRTEVVQTPIPYPMSFPGAAPQAAPVAPAAAAPEEEKPKVPAGAIVFTSPMVGTFYRSPSPDSDPFVKVGDIIDAESTICIVEAMKVMNEIKAEQAAEVLEILVENGEPVEFGQPLFLLKP